MRRTDSQHRFLLLLLSGLISNMVVMIGMARANAMDGAELMDAVYERHKQYPFVYEEQSMIMLDKQGNRSTRQARLYTRIEEDGLVHFLLVFHHPLEIKGVAILATRRADGTTQQSIYIPALGNRLIQSNSEHAAGNFLGTDFSVESLVGEDQEQYDYVLHNEYEDGGYEYQVLDAMNKSTGLMHHRHHIRKDILFITRTEFYNASGINYKQQTFHDIHPLHEGMWRSNMMLMRDIKQRHESLIKIDHRVFSEDYVPREMFTAAWLFEHYPYIPETEAVIEDQPIEDRLEDFSMNSQPFSVPAP